MLKDGNGYFDDFDDKFLDSKSFDLGYTRALDWVLTLLEGKE